MSAPQIEIRWDRRIAPHRRAAIERLVPLARELAAKAGHHGITVSNLRLAAVKRGLLTGQETGRELSYLGAVLTAAGLAKTGAYRRSIIERSHGNLHAVFAAPEHAGGTP